MTRSSFCSSITTLQRNIFDKFSFIYLPYHSFKPWKSSIKLRIIFDASAKLGNGVFLSGNLLWEPVLLNLVGLKDLIGVLE